MHGRARHPGARDLARQRTALLKTGRQPTEHTPGRGLQIDLRCTWRIPAQTAHPRRPASQLTGACASRAREVHDGSMPSTSLGEISGAVLAESTYPDQWYS